MNKLFPIFLFFFLIVAYSDGLFSPFYYDDYSSILNNPSIQITELSTDAIADVIHNSQVKRRPVSNISFALNYLWDSINPAKYHLVNVSIHIVTALAVYFLFLEIYCKMPEFEGVAHVMAFATAGIWGLNPLQTQAVTYIVQRMTSLASMFYILAFYTYLKFRRGREYKKIFGITTLLLFLLAAGSKEIAITFPLMVLLFEYFFITDRKIKKMVVATAISLGTICFIILVYIDFSNPFDFINDQIINRAIESKSAMDEDISMYERLLTESKIVFYYISLFIFPIPARQMLFHSYPVSRSFFEPLTLLSISSIIALIAGSFKIKKSSFVSFFILWYFINLALESSFIKLYLIFEHRLYLPSVAIAAILVYTVFKYGKISKVTSNRIFTVTILIIFSLSMLTYNRNSMWQYEGEFYEDNLKKNPTSQPLQRNIAVFYRNSGMFEKAIKHFNIAIELSPDDFRSYLHKGLTYNMQEMWIPAIKEFDIAKTLAPNEPGSYFYSGMAYMGMGHLKKAEQELNIAHNIDSDSNYNVLTSKGILYGKMGQFDRAVRFFDMAIAIKADHLSAYMEKAKIYSKIKQLDLAIKTLNIALQINPFYLDAYIKRSEIFHIKGDREKAVKDFQAAFEVDPTAPALKSLAALLGLKIS